MREGLATEGIKALNTHWFEALRPQQHACGKFSVQYTFCPWELSYGARAHATNLHCKLIYIPSSRIGLIKLTSQTPVVPTMPLLIAVIRSFDRFMLSGESQTI